MSELAKSRTKSDFLENVRKPDLYKSCLVIFKFLIEIKYKINIPIGHIRYFAITIFSNGFYKSLLFSSV